jgi:hypothetical protein
MAATPHGNDTDEPKPRTDTEDVDLNPRTVRALEEYITITPEVGRARDADHMVIATSESGSSYLVDLQSNACECPDSEHRDPTLGCKHIQRARFALGRWPIPVKVAEKYDVDPDLGQHTDATIEFEAASGFIAAREE